MKTGMTRDREKGVALLMVVVVIAALMIIAVPFMASMRLAEKSSKNFMDKKRAEWAARGALNHAIVSLYATHDDNERYNLLNGGGASGSTFSGFDSPDFDDYDELLVPPLPLDVSLSDGTSKSFNDPRGEMWSVEAQDEQGKVNINSATPWLIANLLGVTELSASIKVDETIIPVEDPSIFYSDGDPDTIDGYVRVDTEYIAYRGISEGALTGCLRGIFLVADEHKRGALVYDGRAFKVSEHRSHDANRQLRLFSTPESIREISSWTKFDAVAEALLYRQLYIDKLKDLGVDEQDIEDAKIDPGRLIEPEKPDYTPDQKDVNKKLAEYGYDTEKLRGLLGDSVVDRIGRRIPSSMPENSRRRQWFEQMTQAFNEYIEEIEAEEQAKTDRLKKFLPQAFRNIKTLKEVLFLETFGAIDYKRIKGFITTYSWRSRDWSRATRIRDDVPEITRGYTNRRRLPIADTRHFNRGTLVRISSANSVEYAVVAGRDRFGRVVTDRDIVNSYVAGEARVQACLRHPVNINSCSDRVLKALLVGLRHEPFESDIRYIMRGRQQRQKREPDWITVKEAEELVKLIRESPPTCHEDLNGILESAAGMDVISDRDKVALLTNAINPNDPSLVASTTGFCYKSYNIFSLKATGIINSPVGTELARHTIHQVVEIAPPMTVAWTMDSQQDFSPGIVRWLDRNSGRKSVLQFDDREANHLTTTPNSLNANWAFPSHSHDPQEGDFKIEAGRLNDGNKYTEHYDQTIDGQSTQNGIPVQTASQFPIIPERRGRNPQSVGTGYCAFWFKPSWSAGAHYFLDHAKGEYESRVTFYYDGSDLVLMVCDAGLDQIGNTLRAPYTFDADTWYHVACSWKGVRYGDLAMFVDGRSLGTYENVTRLVGDIDDKVYQITVENASDLPLGPIDASRGWFPAIKVDSEAMNVVEINGNTLTILSQLEAATTIPPPAGWTPQLIRASVRGTVPTYHKDGAVVTILGYSSFLKEDLRVGGALTVYDLPSPTPQTIVNRPRNPADPAGTFNGVLATDVEVLVVSTANFPPEGFILIDQEKIYYSGFAVDKFTGCVRGMENTTAADHSNGAFVKLISLKVTNTTDYKDSGYVQLDDEWIKYEKAKDANYKQQYFIMPYGSGGGGGPVTPPGGGGPGIDPRRGGRGGRGGDPIPLPPRGGSGLTPRPVPRPRRPGSILLPDPLTSFESTITRGIGIFPQPVPPGPIPLPISDSCRGQEGTVSNSHAAGTKVIPVFDVQRDYSGGGDMVTVIDAQQKNLMQVNHSSGKKVALTDFAPRQFNQNEWGRLLKWPSGELPTEVQPITMIGGSALGGAGVMGMIDEITVSGDTVHSPYATYGFVANVDLGPNDTSMVFGVRQSHGGNQPPGGSPGPSSAGGVPQLRQYGGLIKIDDEIIGVVDVDSGSSTFGRLKRGLLGSIPAAHAEGARIYIIPYPRAGVFDGGLTEETIPCRNPGQTPRQGYIQVARTDGCGEIVPYRYSRRREFRRYADIYGQGVFRGAFGSPVTGFSSSDLGIFMPFRYHDLYEPNRDSRQGVYFLAINNFNYAYFRGITWDATVPQGTLTKVQVRIDGRPGWDTAPSNKKGGIFEFLDPDGENLIGVMGQRVEIRVYLTYAQDAYLSNAWKDTPIVRSITLEYDQPCIVHHHETPKE